MYSVYSGIANVLEQYRKGPSVAFPAFTSSSSDRNITFDFAKPLSNENILLVMDNFQPSFLRPRDIMGFFCISPSKINACVKPSEKKSQKHILL